MTKDFCNECKKEVSDNSSVRISMAGAFKDISHGYERIHLCENCYRKVDNNIKKLIPISKNFLAKKSTETRD
jgi:hypothetical protein